MVWIYVHGHVVVHAGRADVEGGGPLDAQGVEPARVRRRGLVAVVVAASRGILFLGAGGVGPRRPEDEEDSPVVVGRARVGGWRTGRGDPRVGECRPADRPVGLHAAARDDPAIALARGHRPTAMNIQTRAGGRTLEVIDAGLQVEGGPARHVYHAVPRSDRATRYRATRRLEHLGPRDCDRGLRN